MSYMSMEYIDKLQKQIEKLADENKQLQKRVSCLRVETSQAATDAKKWVVDNLDAIKKLYLQSAAE